MGPVYLGSNSNPSEYLSYVANCFILAKCGLIDGIPPAPVISGLIKTNQSWVSKSTVGDKPSLPANRVPTPSFSVRIL